MSSTFTTDPIVVDTLMVVPKIVHVVLEIAAFASSNDTSAFQETILIELRACTEPRLLPSDPADVAELSTAAAALDVLARV